MMCITIGDVILQQLLIVLVNAERWLQSLHGHTNCIMSGTAHPEQT